MPAPFEANPRHPSVAINAMASMAGAGTADTGETEGVDAVAKSHDQTDMTVEKQRQSQEIPNLKLKQNIRRPALPRQAQYVYAYPAPSLDTVVAEMARSHPISDSESEEVDWKLLTAAAARRPRTPSVTSNDTALLTPAMSTTSVASTLLSRETVHSSTTITTATTRGDQYGWEEELTARTSVESGASEETAKSLRGVLTAPIVAPDKGFLGKKGLLWKVLTMNTKM